MSPIGYAYSTRFIIKSIGKVIYAKVFGWGAVIDERFDFKKRPQCILHYGLIITIENYKKIYLSIKRIASTYRTGLIFFAFPQTRLMST